ncbi:MAG: DNA repair protein RecN [Prevotella sp.]|nr:DNA repair protein RecN [Prevotella sp.]
MLKQLYIKNFTLIDELDMNFHGGFSVITGETGAGKSIILGAIGLLLGQRADAKSIKQGTEKCIIEAHFDLSRYQLEPFFEQNEVEYDATDTIVRRELTAVGKSRAFINDTPVALSVLKDLGERLVDVHSQHQNLLLNKQDFQLSVVDVIAGCEKENEAYRHAFAHYQEATRRLEAMREEVEQARQNTDFLQFQYDELSAARLIDGEQEELEQRADTMTHAEDIKSALYEAEQTLTGDEGSVVSSLRKAAAALRAVEHVCPGAPELAERMESSYIELKDVAQEVSSKLEDVDFDPSELDAVNSRLDKIYDLQKKYHAETVAQLLTRQAEIQAQLSAIENGDEALADLERRVADARQSASIQADVLTKKRRKAAIAIEKQMQSHLVPLGMPSVRFQVSIEPLPELGRSGRDRVSFLFSANASTPLQPVSQVASGGEIARVMLSLKAMISGAVKLPTIIFDEIDTGVSGKIAEQMAKMMAEMGANDRQVISITHLPQIAALGSTHYKVYKEETPQGTKSHMVMLTETERVEEIAQMLSGSAVTDAAIQHARELLRFDISIPGNS